MSISNPRHRNRFLAFRLLPAMLCRLPFPTLRVESKGGGDRNLALPSPPPSLKQKIEPIASVKTRQPTSPSERKGRKERKERKKVKRGHHETDGPMSIVVIPLHTFFVVSGREGGRERERERSRPCIHTPSVTVRMYPSMQGTRVERASTFQVARARNRSYRVSPTQSAFSCYVRVYPTGRLLRSSENPKKEFLFRPEAYSAVVLSQAKM